MARRVVVALVQAEVLFLIRNGRSVEDHRSRGRGQQFRVRPIDSGDHGGERPPLLVHQHAPFRPRFAAIGPVTRSVGVVVQFGERGTIKTVIHWNETEDELVRISTVAFTACP